MKIVKILSLLIKKGDFLLESISNDNDIGSGYIINNGYDDDNDHKKITITIINGNADENDMNSNNNYY